jgi:hypothetical protein
MFIFKKTYSENINKILRLFLVLMLFYSCNAYKKSTNLEQSSQIEQTGIVKVTMVNGDELIYESIEFTNENYYGVKTVNGEKTKAMLLKEEVLKVERQNKSSSGFFGLIGITIGVASILLIVLMFGG